MSKKTKITQLNTATEFSEFLDVYGSKYLKCQADLNIPLNEVYAHIAAGPLEFDAEFYNILKSQNYTPEFLTSILHQLCSDDSDDESFWNTYGNTGPYKIISMLLLLGASMKRNKWIIPILLEHTYDNHSVTYESYLFVLQQGFDFNCLKKADILKYVDLAIENSVPIEWINDLKVRTDYDKINSKNCLAKSKVLYTQAEYDINNSIKNITDENLKIAVAKMLTAHKLQFDELLDEYL